MNHQSSDETSSSPNTAFAPAGKQNSELHEMLERISEGFFEVDHKWQITYVNRRFEAILSIRQEDCLHQNLWSSIPDLHGTPYGELLQQAMQQKVKVKYERFSSVHQRWVEVTAYPSPTGLSVFVRDITEQKTTEEALRLSNERFRLAAKTDAIYDWDLPTNHLYWGEGLRELFGYTQDELQIPQWTAALHPDDVVALREDLHQTLQNSAASSWEQEYRIFNKEGRLCFVYERGHIIRDETGKAIRMVGVMQNITERKLLEQELEQQRKQTTAAIIRAQEQERAQIGRELHDNVNQVLTTVKLYQEMILSGVGEREVLLNKSARLLQQSINEIRSLSQRLSAPMVVNGKLKDTVEELLHHVRSTNKFELLSDTAAIETLEISDDLHLAIYRILQEQLTNILKYAKASQVAVYFNWQNQTLELTVTDNGIGFDPLQKRNGMGITNMKVRAESLCGTLDITSAPGKGCRLMARFPLTQ